MAEYIRSIKVIVEVDTNKRTLVETRDYDSLDDAERSVEPDVTDMVRKMREAL